MDKILEMKNIDKSFPGVQALSDVSINVRSQEVHVIVGENGAGKSTLMNILAGVHNKDGGEIILDGKEVEIKDTSTAHEYGIRMIHQELKLVPEVSVAENIYMGRFSEIDCGKIFSWGKVNEKAREALDELNLNIDPTLQLKKLSVAKRQMVEIVRAISSQAKIIIMDEPTSSLADAEIEELFKQIRLLKEKGVSIIYISHRLPEIEEIGDRVTILRDGKYIGTFGKDEISKDEIIKKMVGRDLKRNEINIKDIEKDREEVLRVQNLSTKKNLKNVSFSLIRGEVLGFAGLVGAGRTELMRAIFGIDNKIKGDIFINKKKVDIDSPQKAINYGIGFLTEDREASGFIENMPIFKNITLASLNNFINRYIIQYQKEREKAEEYYSKLNIVAPSINTIVNTLSGGNKQKVVLAKWLCSDSNILILDEPTRGIDVGAKSEIYNLIEDLKRQGKSIILVSSELPEILNMSNRIAVMSEGELTGILDNKEATQEKIMHLATKAMK